MARLAGTGSKLKRGRGRPQGITSFSRVVSIRLDLAEYDTYIDEAAQAHRPLGQLLRYEATRPIAPDQELVPQAYSEKACREACGADARGCGVVCRIGRLMSE